MERVESGGSPSGAPYAAFERSVLLAEQVRERTDALHRALDELGRVNARLLAANAQAEAANLSKTRFLAAVSHDLLQPLNAARLFASALETHTLPDASQALVGHIGRSLKDVEGLLGTLVDISRLDAGVLHADKAPFAVSTLLDALAEEYHGKAKVGKLDVDSNGGVAMKYRVQGIPTLLLFKNGQVAATKIGAEPKQKLVSWINTAIS